MIFRILALLLILTLAFTVYAISQEDPPSETPQEAAVRLQRERDQAIAERDAAVASEEATLVELQNERDKTKVLENQAERDEEGDTIQRVLSAIDSVLQTPLAPLYDEGERLLTTLAGRCDNCGRHGVKPREHNHSCKANHSWWTCDPGDYKWQHGHCCRAGQVWTDSFGCVQPGYSPPARPWYGSGSSSSSSSSSSSNDPG